MRKKTYTQLSTNTEVVHPKKGYKVVSLPEGMWFGIDGGFRVDKKIPVVVIIDEFVYNPNAYYRYQQAFVSPDLLVNRGDLVTKYAVHGLEDKVGVLAIEHLVGGEMSQAQKLEEALEALIEMQKQYQNIVAVNISIRSSAMTLSYGFFSRSGIRAHDLKNEKERAVELLNNRGTLTYYKLIGLVNELVDMGVEVYTNTKDFAYHFRTRNQLQYPYEAEKAINIFTLSNAHSVTDSKGEYANRQMASCSANGTHYFRRKFDKDRKALYITDGHIGFYADEVEHPWLFRLTNIFYVLLIPLAIYCFFLIYRYSMSMYEGSKLFFTSLLMDSLLFVPLIYIFMLRRFAVKGTTYAAAMKLNEDLKTKLNAEEQKTCQ